MELAENSKLLVSEEGLQFLQETLNHKRDTEIQASKERYDKLLAKQRAADEEMIRRQAMETERKSKESKKKVFTYKRSAMANRQENGSSQTLESPMKPRNLLNGLPSINTNELELPKISAFAPVSSRESFLVSHGDHAGHHSILLRQKEHFVPSSIGNFEALKRSVTKLIKDESKYVSLKAMAIHNKVKAEETSQALQKKMVDLSKGIVTPRSLELHLQVSRQLGQSLAANVSQECAKEMREIHRIKKLKHMHSKLTSTFDERKESSSVKLVRMIEQRSQPEGVIDQMNYIDSAFHEVTEGNRRKQLSIDARKGIRNLVNMQKARLTEPTGHRKQNGSVVSRNNSTEQTSTGPSIFSLNHVKLDGMQTQRAERSKLSRDSKSGAGPDQRLDGKSLIYNLH